MPAANASSPWYKHLWPWIIIAILMVISHRARMPQAATATPTEALDETTVISR